MSINRTRIDKYKQHLLECLINEDGGAVMSSGTGGFGNAASASGPVAGYDPPLRKNTIKKRKYKLMVMPKGPTIPYGGDNF